MLCLYLLFLSASLAFKVPETIHTQALHPPTPQDFQQQQQPLHPSTSSSNINYLIQLTSQYNSNIRIKYIKKGPILLSRYLDDLPTRYVDPWIHLNVILIIINLN